MQWSLISQIIFCIYLDDVNLDILKLGFLGIFIDWVPVHELIVAIIAIVRICTCQSYIAFTFLIQFICSTLFVFVLSYVSVFLHHGAFDWSLVCDYVISWSYFFSCSYSLTNFAFHLLLVERYVCSFYLYICIFSDNPCLPLLTFFWLNCYQCI